MPALNFLIPAGRGAPTLCFEGSPACAHLRGRAGCLCPPLSSPDSSRRHLSPPAWCEGGQDSTARWRGGWEAMISPFPCCSKTQPEGKGSCKPLVGSARYLPQSPMSQGGLQGALGLLRTWQRLTCPAWILLHSSPAGGQGGCGGSRQEGSRVTAPCQPWGHPLGECCCPRPPPCEGQAAGERRGVTQTGKLAGTHPFPAGAGKRRIGSCSEPKPAALVAATGTPKCRTEPTPGSSQGHPIPLCPPFAAHPELDGSQIPWT